MIVILNNKTHVGANPPSDTTKTWISADMTEISIYPEPETYGRLNERIDVKAILLEHNLDIKSDRIRVFSLADDILEVKRYINGEWIVVDNPDNYVDIIMNGKVIGTMEVDSIAPGEEVEEWDGSGIVIEEIVSASLITFTIDGTSYQAEEGMTWAKWVESDYYPLGLIDELNKDALLSGGTEIKNGDTIQTWEDVLVDGAIYEAVPNIEII